MRIGKRTNVLVEWARLHGQGSAEALGEMTVKSVIAKLAWIRRSAKKARAAAVAR